MKRFALLALSALTVAACSSRTSNTQVLDPLPPDEVIMPVYSSSSSSLDFDIRSSSGSSASSEDMEMKTVTLVNRSFEKAVGAKGADWLRAIGAVKLTGNVEAGNIKVKLSRGPDDDGKGWSALGMYLAPLAHSTDGFDYPNETVYGTNLHFVDAQWRGDCQRHLSPNSSFGVIKGHSNSTQFALGGVPLTAADPCSTETRIVDLRSIINEQGLFLGFMPSDGRYAAEITLEYIGELEVTHMDW